MKGTPPSLSKREVALLGEWERTGVGRVTTADLAAMLDVSRPTAAAILSRLAHKRALDPVGRGVYEVRPMRAVGILWATSALVAIANLLQGRDYYVGGPVALTTHHLTEQVYHSVIDVFVVDRRPHQTLGQARIVFHTLGWTEAYLVGITGVPTDQVTIRMSDPERTLLDLVDRPDLLGSARSAMAVVRRALDRVDVARLIGYAARWPRRATRQRLGFMLDRAGVSRAGFAPLLQGGRPPHVVPLLVDEPAHGPIYSPWRVRANDVGGELVTTRDRV